ncbi:hypothetical protein PaG_01818 [Moesziomyces aphidis]|uniref:Uncharacterized protein n=1 Tax=Moesziomyces aphidis TaxID=84754 RepID=W3VPV8_MOEAP|nr:hypothetical protein PaG_01818 [Moesziomyces aphidis]
MQGVRIPACSHDCYGVARLGGVKAVEQAPAVQSVAMLIWLDGAAGCPTEPRSSVGLSGDSSGPQQPARIVHIGIQGARRELPPVPNTFPLLAFAATAAVGSWGAFTVYATNKEKLSSSIFKSILAQVKSSPSVHSLLSSTPVLKRELWLGGVPHVKGAVNMMQGRVDLSFKITTDKEEDEATVYFTSIRAHKHAPFEIIRFLVVSDKGSVSLLDQGLTTIDDEGDIV